MARVFVSHTGSDDDVASRISAWMRADGHEVFLDHDLQDGLRLGAEWQPRLYERLRAADAVVCVVSRAFVNSVWCSAELGAALNRGSKVLPVIVERGTEHPLLSQLQKIELDGEPDRVREALSRELARISATGGSGWPDGKSPYPGLRAFDLSMRRAFFGRGEETTRIAEVLRSPEREAAGEAVLVVGPSGCGKSSLVRAAVAPLMAEEPGWTVLRSVEPGPDPVRSLATEVVRAGRDLGLSWTLADVAERVRSEGIVDLADQLLRADRNQSRLLVVVDQLEELLTISSPDSREAFLAILADACRARRDGVAPVHVVATIRSAYLDDLAAAGGGRLPLQVFSLQPLRPDLLRKVITEPADLARIEIEDDLVDRLVTDTGDGEALPLLAFTLEQLAESGATALSMDRYEELGGVRGALARQADKALAATAADGGRDPVVLVNGLLALVTVDENARPARRTVRRDEIERAVGGSVDAFVDRRLLAVGTDDDGNEVVTVTHEALLSAWPPLAAAITEAAAALRARRAVELAASEWDQRARPPSLLWERGQLAAALGDVGQAIAKRPDPGRPAIDLSPAGRDFLTMSRRRDRRRRQRSVTVLSGLLALSLGAGGVALVQGRAAEREQKVAVARQLALQGGDLLEGDPRTALRMYAAAASINPSDLTEGSLAAALVSSRYAGTLDGVFASATADGSVIAMIEGTSDLVLWEIAEGESPRRASDSPIPIASTADILAPAEFSPDGTVLATNAADGQVELWSVADPAHVTRLARIDTGRSGPEFLTFSPDGKMLAAGILEGGGGWDLLWDIQDPSAPQRVPVPRELAMPPEVVTSDLGSAGLLVQAIDAGVSSFLGPGTVRLWSVGVDEPQLSSRSIKYARDIAIAPAAGLAAAVGDASDFTLWDIDRTAADGAWDPRRMGTLAAKLEGAPQLSWWELAEDGTWLAAAYTVDVDTDLLVAWDLRDPKNPRNLIEDLPPNPLDEVPPEGDGLPGDEVLQEGDGLPGDEVLQEGDGLPGDEVLQEGDGLPGDEVLQEGDGLPGDEVPPEGEELPEEDGFPDSLGPDDLGDPPTEEPVTTAVLEVGSVSNAHVLPGMGAIATVTGLDDQLTIWDLEAGGSISMPDLASGGGLMIEFLPDGTAVTAADVGTSTRWDLVGTVKPLAVGPGFQPVALEPGLSTSAQDLRFTADGSLQIAWGDGRVDTHDLTDTHAPELTEALDGPPQVLDAIVALAANRVIYGLGTGSILVMDLSRPADAGRIEEDVPGKTDMSTMMPVASPDGDLVAATTWDGWLQLWDVTDLPNPRAVGEPFEIEASYVVFSPDGGRLVGVGNGSVALYDLAGPSEPSLLGKTSIAEANGAVFSPDGHFLAVLGSSGVYLIDMRNPAQPSLVGTSLPSREPTALTFSQDSSLLAVGDYRGGVTLWDVSDPDRPRRLGPRLPAHTSSVASLAFSGSGDLLATGGTEDGWVRTWDLSSITSLRDNAMAAACARVGEFDQAEWERYVPGLPYKSVCP